MNIHDLTRVRLAETRQVAELLARAFQDDPLMRYAIPDHGERGRLLPWLISLNVRDSCRSGEVYATRGYEGAAVWRLPRHTTMTFWRMLRAGMMAAPLRVRWSILRRLATAENTSIALHKRWAPGPHWYLSQIGVEPSQRRQGIASRLLQPMLARIDAATLPCYLETENEANIAFYHRFGFQVVAEGSVPDGGPRIWALLRPARGT